MLQHEIDAENGILSVMPSGELSAMDFKHLTDAVDDYNARHAPLSAENNQFLPTVESCLGERCADEAGTSGR